MTDMEFIKTKTSKSDPVVKKGKQSKREGKKRTLRGKGRSVPNKLGLQTSQAIK